MGLSFTHPEHPEDTHIAGISHWAKRAPQSLPSSFGARWLLAKQPQPRYSPQAMKAHTGHSQHKACKDTFPAQTAGAMPGTEHLLRGTTSCAKNFVVWG